MFQQRNLNLKNVSLYHQTEMESAVARALPVRARGESSAAERFREKIIFSLHAPGHGRFFSVGFLKAELGQILRGKWLEELQFDPHQLAGPTFG